MHDYNLSAELDPHNSGVLVVHLTGSGGGSRDAGFTRELAKHASGNEEQVSRAAEHVTGQPADVPAVLRHVAAAGARIPIRVVQRCIISIGEAPARRYQRLAERCSSANVG